MKTAEKKVTWEAVQIEEGLFHILPVERTASRVPIAIVDHHRDGHEQTRTVTAPANAALLAAAPDLLRELNHLVRFMEPVEQTGLNIPGLATLNGARAAISKAENTL